MLFTVHAAAETDKAMGASYWETLDSGIRLFADSADASVPEAPEGTVAKGVDISKYQGEIDFEALKDEVDFVIIRCGFGQDQENQDDSTYETYVKGCRDYNIPYGVYLYSYATTVAGAKGEAAHALRLLKMCNEWETSLSLPVFYDMEDEDQMKNTSKALKGDMAETFCTILQDEGYKTGVYSNLTSWKKYLTDSYFDSTIRWVAQYNDVCTYQKVYAIWQCSDSASINGIKSAVDLDYMIQDIYVSPEAVVAKGYTGIYDGKAHTVTIKNQKPGTDIEYSTDQKIWSTVKPTRTKAGTTTVYYRMTDQYGRKKTGSLSITIKTISISSCSIASISNQTYTGKQIKPSPVVKYKGATLKKGTDYTLSYGTNKATGKATVKVTGKGNYAGSVTKTFYIVPKKVTISSVKKGTKKRSAVLQWKKAEGASGYEITYCVKGTKKWKNVNVTSVKKTFTGLSATQYYVKIRAYKTVSGKKYYGAYSAQKIMTPK
jgi:GH25 family lysozyme M1 (1,4-beta-N-acetylmuramidase)